MLLNIKDEDLIGLSEKVVLITGGSSGIGLATASLLLERGALVVVGDQNPLPEALLAQYGQRVIHIPTDVAVWTSLLNLFDASISQHKRIDHVFVAAGVRGFKADYLGESFDPSTGALQEPPSHTFDINLRAAINTAYLGLYHMRHQSPAKGSIVVTGSASAFLRFRNTDYTVAKHGILGFMRGLVPALAEHHSHIRINCVSPSWTRTGMLHSSTFDDVGYGDQMQDPEVVAKSAVLLMADEKRHGQNIYSRQGKFWEVESVFLKAARDIVGEVDEDVILKAVMRRLAEEKALEAAKKAQVEAAEIPKE